jgi:hypothetical protein
VTAKKRWLILCGLLTGVGAIALWIRYPEIVGFGPFCPFHKITGIPCPGCGGTRATEALIYGRIWEAITINPVAIAFDVTVAVLVGWFALDTLRGKDTLLPRLLKKWNPWLTATILTIITINWIWTIYKEFWG